jgi:hypothetical protein
VTRKKKAGLLWDLHTDADARRTLRMLESAQLDAAQRKSPTDSWLVEFLQRCMDGHDIHIDELHCQVDGRTSDGRELKTAIEVHRRREADPQALAKAVCADVDKERGLKPGSSKKAYQRHKRDIIRRLPSPK